MSDIAIKVEGLSKRYLVGHQAEKQKYVALRDVIARNTASLARKTVDMFKGRPIVQGDEVEEFWALKDIDFEIKQGDRVGIIGRNGAGKSTLLKILSRITEPTSGRVQISGCVASLLEVGTGFHPELTGRENIFLNGAILGMSRAEIQKKFDEIVAFAEVEKFLDTPVKRYSSGMYMRLAFSVAAYLQSEILLVDEVLAVGDANFQKKCLSKLESLGKDRTVLLVSHNLSAISQLCHKGLLLAEGTLKGYGNIRESLKQYALLSGNTSATRVWEENEIPGRDGVYLKKVLARSDIGEELENTEQAVCIEIEIYVDQDVFDVSIGLVLSEELKGDVIHTETTVSMTDGYLKKGLNILTYSIPAPLLREGTYQLTIGAAIPLIYQYFLENNVLTFTLHSTNSHINRYQSSMWRGAVTPEVGVWAIKA